MIFEKFWHDNGSVAVVGLSHAGMKLRLLLFRYGCQDLVLGFLRATRHLPRVARGTARPKLRSGGQDTEWITTPQILKLRESATSALLLQWDYENEPARGLTVSLVSTTGTAALRVETEITRTRSVLGCQFIIAKLSWRSIGTEARKRRPVHAWRARVISA